MGPVTRSRLSGPERSEKRSLRLTRPPNSRLWAFGMMRASAPNAASSTAQPTGVFLPPAPGAVCKDISRASIRTGTPSRRCPAAVSPAAAPATPRALVKPATDAANAFLLERWQPHDGRWQAPANAAGADEIELQPIIGARHEADEAARAHEPKIRGWCLLSVAPEGQAISILPHRRVEECVGPAYYRGQFQKTSRP